jgi:hypothetical protein
MFMHGHLIALDSLADDPGDYDEEDEEDDEDDDDEDDEDDDEGSGEKWYLGARQGRLVTQTPHTA